MRVTARCAINHDGELYDFGDELVLSPEDVGRLGDAVEIIEDGESEIFPPDEEAPKRKGRPKKN